MYSVIIADDEPWVLLGIKKTFKWDLYGFTVIGDTTDASEAVELILAEKPDIVFTDVLMPIFTGIDLVRIAKENKLNTKFVIISGHAEFKYAQEAIKCGVFEYCLKPIEQEDADRILFTLKKALDEEKGIYSDIVDNKDVASLSFKKMISYINKNYMLKFQLSELAARFNLNPNYCCSLFKKHFDTNFSNYVIDIRMKASAKLMTQGDLNIQQIAELVGYDDYYYFCKIFKKYFGLTPYQYRSSKL